jgi:1,4-dihydroxy-6-naphthoate synthase
MRLTIGFSPCPNDTFIFDAMVHKKIDLEGLEFDVRMTDVEELNSMAFSEILDVTKLSYHAMAWLLDKYMIMESGSALGNNCGPLLIAKRKLTSEDIHSARIAIPGKYTTANLLLSLAYPAAVNKVAMVFSQIEDAILNRKVDAGLIIHENRFTYLQKGLLKIIDLGEYWESNYKVPIPLGAIAVRRSLPEAVREKINRVIERSVAFAMKHPASSASFVKCHAQSMAESVMHQHIKLYVNDYTLKLGETGRNAVNRLFQAARSHGIIPSYKGEIFLN